MTRPEPKYKKVDKWVYGEVKEIELIGFDKKFENEGKFGSITGDLDMIKDIEIVDQNPIGRSSRSNPATYSKAYDNIRKVFAKIGEKLDRDIKPANFSFNVDGGRCDECLGEGIKKVEMQFMADLFLECDSCKGQRFIKNIVEIKCKEKNINEVLNMTIDEAISFFSSTTS